MGVHSERRDCCRRRVLRLGCLAVVGSLAGCPGGDDGTGSPTADGSATERPRLRDVLAWESSYAMDLGVPLGSGRIVVHEGNTYTDWTVNGVRTEVFRIGTEAYVVVAGECFRTTDTSGDFFDPEELLAESGTVRATGRRQVDGRSVYRFDLDAGVLYLRTDTGYPVRFDLDDDQGVVTFHSWGDTDPVTPPETECPGEFRN